MRAKVKFPHRPKPVEREVRQKPYGTFYIRSKGKDVTVVPVGQGVYEVAAAWRSLYGRDSRDGE